MNLKLLAKAWILMIGTAYAIVATITPQIATNNPSSFYAVLSTLFLLTLIAQYTCEKELVNKNCTTLTRLIFLCLGIAEVYGGVTAWTVMQPAALQISIACADLVSAVFLFVMAFSKWDS